MPLLQGTFDPLRLNAQTLADEWLEAEDIEGDDTDAREQHRLELVSLFQSLLDSLWHRNIIR